MEMPGERKLMLSAGCFELESAKGASRGQASARGNASKKKRNNTARSRPQEKVARAALSRTGQSGRILLPAAALPVQISRHADQDDRHAPETFHRPLDGRVQYPRQADQHIDRGKPGISSAT